MGLSYFSKPSLDTVCVSVEKDCSSIVSRFSWGWSLRLCGGACLCHRSRSSLLVYVVGNGGWVLLDVDVSVSELVAVGVALDDGASPLQCLLQSGIISVSVLVLARGDVAVVGVILLGDVRK